MTIVVAIAAVPTVQAMATGAPLASTLNCNVPLPRPLGCPKSVPTISSGRLRGSLWRVSKGPCGVAVERCQHSGLQE
jgi:hypothetical protein